ncbi:RteC domain-containing protein [uncultured Polaribacter sp.]|uniref:RteC domain-containing protein n=1 Tax=uncultured Polaribacter sp. TaxID=174711 RepID=UPI002627F018|nr:RteC domain-containing protein [uncultured Polaribacter sp.]
MRDFFRDALDRVNAKELTAELYELTVQESHQLVVFLKEIILELKKEILHNEFVDKKEEITFFKEVKPYIMGRLFFYNYVFHIESSRPIGDPLALKIYYKKELKKILKNNATQYNTCFFYQYVRAKREDKDQLFFTRGNKDVIYSAKTFFFEIDSKFTTLYDCLLALMISEEKLCHYIFNKTATVSSTSKPFKPLQWVASKNAMIELIYSLYTSQSISQATLRQIATIFELVFNIRLGDIHHAFHRMKYRTKSRTLFLDELKMTLENHIQTGDL